jgi:hypothetical protein
MSARDLGDSFRQTVEGRQEVDADEVRANEFRTLWGQRVPVYVPRAYRRPPGSDCSHSDDTSESP